MKVTVEARVLRSLLGYSLGGDFGTVIGPKANVGVISDLARAVVNHALVSQHLMRALPSDSGKKLGLLTAEQMTEAVRGWCGNEPRPLLFPLPIVWPPAPDPNPWKFSRADLVALAVQLESGVALLQEPLLRDALTQAVELALKTGAAGQD